MRCPNCLENNPPGAQTCTNCGNSIGHLEAAANYAATPEGQALMDGERVPPPPPKPEAPRPKVGIQDPKLMKKFLKEKAALDKLRAKGKLDPATHEARVRDLKLRYQIP